MDSHAEYKQVTVLFADVVHSMDIAAALGAERLREIMTELFNRSSKVVQRYGGTVDKFTGDGIMAVFGAPIALEDHAIRACRAALDIHTDLKQLATTLEMSDEIKLELRIGLNSGQVIAGEIGSGPLAYTAIGEQVGMAQRMESVATPGGVMISESTARLVENTATLGEVELVRIKGSDDPVPARRLLAISTGRGPNRVETSLVGRQWEIGALSGLLDRAGNGNGCVVGVVGPPGIGKSRIVREITSRATDAEFEMFTTYCESHTTDVPFHAAAGLVRAITSSNGLDGAAARTQVRARFSGADDEDLLILEDLLGIGDPAATLPQIDPDARRRRLAAMVNAAALTRTTPTVYVIEDAHWIDGISESMLADFLSVVPRTRSLVMITYRPEYVGALAHAPRSQTIALEPLDDSQMSQLSTELLGRDRSVTGLADLVAERAAGNPFFAEEIVRDLTERDVLIGGRGCYLCVEPATDVSVPSTLQAVIAARIDRLDPAAKRTLNAAAVIGSRFSPDMLKVLEIEPALHDLVVAELIDQTVFGPRPHYAFRHGLIRAVAYESQLKSDRARLHRRLAETIDHDDQNAALIAEHLEAAGDMHGAYEWHMRAGAWSSNRDVSAAQLSWERARQVADALPPDDPGRSAMRISPRTLLCANAWRRFHPDISARFDELRKLCLAAGDTSSLAVGMAGLTMEHLLTGRIRAASELASEYMAVIEALGDPVLTAGVARAACVAKLQAGEMADVLRWSQTTIDVAGSDSAKGELLSGSPLTIALVFRAVARWTTGQSGWRDDLDRAVAMSRSADAVSRATVMAYKYISIARGIVLADDVAVAEIEEAMQTAERSSDQIAVVLIRMALGIVLVHHRNADSQRGYSILTELRETCIRERYALNSVPILNVYAARENVDNGDIDLGVEQLRAACDGMVETGSIGNLDLATVALVETLLARGSADDITEADLAVERLATSLGEAVWVSRAVSGMRLRALIARARGDEAAYQELKTQYRQASTDLGFEGHMAWAAAMP
jgi:class 3 adenylate cyclase